MAIHNPGSTPQFYISCAQVAVSGGSGTASPATVAIPGAFKASDPGYTANVSDAGVSVGGIGMELTGLCVQIYNNFKSYTVPGPAPVSHPARFCLRSWANLVFSLPAKL